MDIRFRWNMFITSFLPLWAAIVISDLYDISGYIICRWGRLRAPSFDFREAAGRFICVNGLMVGTVVVVTIVVIASIWDLNWFLKTKESEVAPPIGILRRVRKANKLSAEYLIAYILPMVAFDFAEFRGVILFLLYFGVLAFLCIRNSNIYTNIYLELVKKYRMYECDVECTIGSKIHVYENSLVISRRDLTARVNGEICYWDFENDIYLDLEK